MSIEFIPHESSFTRPKNREERRECFTASKTNTQTEQTHKQKQNKHKNTTKDKIKKIAFSHDPDLITSLDHYINDDYKVYLPKDLI